MSRLWFCLCSSASSRNVCSLIRSNWKRTMSKQPCLGPAQDLFGKQRLDYIEQDLGISPYPPNCPLSMTLTEFRERFESLPVKARKEDTEVIIAGRIKSKRESSSKLVFYTIVADQTEVQILAEIKRYAGLSGSKSAEDQLKIFINAFVEEILSVSIYSSSSFSLSLILAFI